MSTASNPSCVGAATHERRQKTTGIAALAAPQKAGALQATIPGCSLLAPGRPPGCESLSPNMTDDRIQVNQNRRPLRTHGAGQRPPAGLHNRVPRRIARSHPWQPAPPRAPGVLAFVRPPTMGTVSVCSPARLSVTVPSVTWAPPGGGADRPQGNGCVLPPHLALRVKLWHL